MTATTGTPTPTPSPTCLYAVHWTSTFTEHHRANVTALQLAAMLGVTVEEVRASSAAEIEYLGRGLGDGLADIEDSDTEMEVDGPYRDDIKVGR